MFCCIEIHSLYNNISYSAASDSSAEMMRVTSDYLELYGIGSTSSKLVGFDGIKRWLIEEASNPPNEYPTSLTRLSVR